MQSAVPDYTRPHPVVIIVSWSWIDYAKRYGLQWLNLVAALGVHNLARKPHVKRRTNALDPPTLPQTAAASSVKTILVEVRVRLIDTKMLSSG